MSKRIKKYKRKLGGSVNPKRGKISIKNKRRIRKFTTENEGKTNWVRRLNFETIFSHIISNIEIKIKSKISNLYEQTAQGNCLIGRYLKREYKVKISIEKGFNPTNKTSYESKRDT